MIYSSMLTMCVLMNPLSKKDLALIFWLGQPGDLLLLIWNQKAPASYPQRVILILWILMISLNLLMHIRQSVNSFILRWYQVKRESRMALKSWQRILSFQMRRKFSLERIWNVFTVWWFDLSGEYLTLSLKDIMVGLLLFLLAQNEFH